MKKKQTAFFYSSLLFLFHCQVLKKLKSGRFQSKSKRAFS